VATSSLTFILESGSFFEATASPENLLDNHAFKMKGFSYLSSYEMMPEYMGAYEDFPKGAIKIAEIDHNT
jgi:hypothetical protein